MLVKNFSSVDFLQRYRLLETNARILNAGSASTRYGNNCINVDIQDKENVDLVCDIQDLPDTIGQFDAVICIAVLQYCLSPQLVARNFHRVLKPGRLLYVDAPWVQHAYALNSGAILSH